MTDDPHADLHALKGPGFAMVHPHTEAGWCWLAALIGEPEMKRHDDMNTHPTFGPELLPELIAAARHAGLAVQETVARRQERNT